MSRTLRPILAVLAAAGAFLAAPASAAYVLPPQEGRLLPEEVRPSELLGAQPWMWFEETFDFGGGPGSGRGIIANRPGGYRDSMAFWVRKDSVWILASAIRTGYASDGHRILWKTNRSDAYFGTELDSTRFFWNGTELDSLCEFSRSGGVMPENPRASSKFVWRDGRPVARDDHAPEDGGARRVEGTYRGDTLVARVDFALDPRSMDTIWTTWRYARDSIEEVSIHWIGLTKDTAAVLWLYRDGKLRKKLSLDEQYHGPSTWRNLGGAMESEEYSYDAQGRLTRVTASWGEYIAHYDEPFSLASQGLSPRLSARTASSLRILGGHAELDLARPARVAVRVVSADGRSRLVQEGLSLPAGRRTLELPAGIPAGIWWLHVEGDGLRLSAPLLRAGQNGSSRSF